MLKKSNLKAPAEPGVYLFRTVSGRVLYVGKAGNLKQRLLQHFQNRDSPVTARLLSRSHEVDFVVTENEHEALQLEYNFVHHYNPPFNIRLKDDKSFPVVEITMGDEFPGVYFSRRPHPDSFTTPPLTDSRRARALVDLIMQVFRLRNCGAGGFRREVPCLYHYIDRCSAPCVEKSQGDDYTRRAKDAVRFLRGRKADVLKRLTSRMHALAGELNFERAQQVKEEIRLLEEFNLKSVVAGRADSSYDALALFLGGESATVLRFSVAGGQVKSRDIFAVSTLAGDPAAAMREFLLSAYGQGNLPRQLAVSPEPAQREGLETFFSNIAGHRILIRSPQRGPRRRILELVSRNLNLAVNRDHYPTLAQGLRRDLGLSHIPRRIEGVDISHFSGRERVGAVVVFEGGQPLRSDYRSYIIRNAPEGDTDAIREVLERRFGRKPPPDPDLLLIDGGVGQLHAAMAVKKQLGFRADLVSLAKREERIYCETGVTLVYPPDSPERFLFQNVRDEAHRRAVTHHRKRRQKI